VTITDPWDRPIPGGEARLAAEAANIIRAFVHDPSPSPRPAPDTSSPH
jgi:hypothetical protein